MSTQDITPSKVDRKPLFMELSEDRINESELPIGMKVGGYTVGSNNLRQGKLDMQAGKERILLGDATEPLTGKGVYLGKHVETNPDSTDYELRVGDPANNEMVHWDGSSLNILGDIDAGDILAAESISANEIKANTITADRMSVNELSAISADIGSINAGSLDAITITGSTITGTLIKTSDTDTRVEMNDSLGVVRDIENGNVRTVMGNGVISFNTPAGVSSGSVFGFGTQQIAVDVGGTNNQYYFSVSSFEPSDSDMNLGGAGVVPAPWNSLVLESPDGTAWQVTVDNSGNLVTSSL